jgi:hypothetical protein
MNKKAWLVTFLLLSSCSSEPWALINMFIQYTQKMAPGLASMWSKRHHPDNLCITFSAVGWCGNNQRFNQSHKGGAVMLLLKRTDP